MFCSWDFCCSAFPGAPAALAAPAVPADLAALAAPAALATLVAPATLAHLQFLLLHLQLILLV